MFYASHMIKYKTRVENLYQQSLLRAKLNREQDLKNNPLVENDYHSPANNNHKLYELGTSINMVNQPYQPTVVRRSK